MFPILSIINVVSDSAVQSTSYDYLPFILLSLLYLCCLMDLYQPFKPIIQSPRIPSPDLVQEQKESKEPFIHPTPHVDRIGDSFVNERLLQIHFIGSLWIFHLFGLQYMAWRVQHFGSQGLMVREIVAFFIGVGGCALRIWARITLGKFFTYIVTIRSGHKLITSGPYKWLIHPSYTGAILLQIGFALFVRSYFLSLFVVVLFGSFIHARVQNEELVLEEEFGESFSKRKQHIARFIPFVF